MLKSLIFNTCFCSGLIFFSPCRLFPVSPASSKLLQKRSLQAGAGGSGPPPLLPSRPLHLRRRPRPRRHRPRPAGDVPVRVPQRAVGQGDRRPRDRAVARVWVCPLRRRRGAGRRPGPHAGPHPVGPGDPGQRGDGEEGFGERGGRGRRGGRGWSWFSKKGSPPPSLPLYRTPPPSACPPAPAPRAPAAPPWAAAA